MSALETFILAVAITVGSFVTPTNSATSQSTQAGGTNGAVTCTSPCRLGDPDCHCGDPGKGAK